MNNNWDDIAVEHMNDFRELLERVEAASGPDPALDVAICDALNFHHEWDQEDGYGQIQHCSCEVGVTDSIDAALALVEKVLPGATWWIQIYESKQCEAQIWRGRYENQVEGKGYNQVASAPLAILAALLRAKIAVAA